MDEPIGSVLSGRYELVRRLGEGGMGAVFEAIDRADGSKCAVKVLHPEHATDAKVIERLYAEVQATSRLSHPNIVRYLTYSQTHDGIPFIVMELLVGVPLSRYLGEGRSYEVGQVVPILRGVLSGLSAAHGQHIVHRDLKPENIFLARASHGGAPVPKLLDFGIAKVMDAAGGGTSKTKTGVLLGTPGYMSPEQIRSPKDVDARTDLWAAGVVLYELLSGTAPFPGQTEMARLAAIVGQDFVPIEQWKPQLAPWRDFFARALAKDPRHRFASAEEMAVTMEALSSPHARVSSEFHVARASQIPARPRTASIPPTQGYDQEPQPFQQTLPSANAAFLNSPQPGAVGARFSSMPYIPVGPAAVRAPATGGYAGRAPSASLLPDVSKVNYRPEKLDSNAGGIPVWIAGLGVAVAFLVGLAVGLLLAH